MIRVNVQALFNELLSNPAAYGITNTTVRACGATPSRLVHAGKPRRTQRREHVPVRRRRAFTTAANVIIAQTVASMIEGPMQMAALGEAPLAVEQANFRALDGRMWSNLNSAPNSKKFNAWVAYDYGSNDIDGTGLSGSADLNTITVGGDVRLSDKILMGMAAGYTENKSDFGNNGGDFKLTETTGSVYAGYGDGPWYVGVSMLVGNLDYSTTRNITLGTGTRNESGDTGGYTYAFRLLGGYWFKTSSDLVHGPWGKVAYQDIVVRGFSENGSSSTALRYGQQDRESLQTSLGWQVGGKWGQVRPWARVTWEYDAKADQRSVQANSVTLGGQLHRPRLHARRQLAPVHARRRDGLRRRHRIHLGFGHRQQERRRRLRGHRRAARAAVTDPRPQEQRGRPRGGLAVSGMRRRERRRARSGAAVGGRSSVAGRERAAQRREEAQPGDRARPVPRRHLAVDEVGRTAVRRRQRLRVAGAERVRLRRHEDARGVAPRRIVVGEFGIAAVRPRRHRVPAGARQRRADVGVAGDGHPRLAPDQVEHGLPRQRRDGGVERGQRRVELGDQAPGRGLGAEDGAEQPEQPRVVPGTQRMRDDHPRHERARRVDQLAAVLVDVDDEVRRPRRRQRGEVDVLGAADLRHAADAFARMHAEAGARDDAIGEAQREQQLGQAGHEAGDARLGAGDGVRDVRPIGARVGFRACPRAVPRAGHAAPPSLMRTRLRAAFAPGADGAPRAHVGCRGLRGARANAASYTGRGSQRSRRPTIAIGHGST